VLKLIAVQLGVVSKGDPQCGSTRIGHTMLTSVGYFRDWIDDQLKK